MVTLAHVEGLLRAAAIRCTARTADTTHGFFLTALPMGEDLLSVLAREGSNRIRGGGVGPWRAGELRELRTRLAQPRPTRSREEVSRCLTDWVRGGNEASPTDDRVAVALADAVMLDLDTLLGSGWHAEQSPLRPTAAYADALLLLGPTARMLLELSRDD